MADNTAMRRNSAYVSGISGAAGGHAGARGTLDESMEKRIGRLMGESRGKVAGGRVADYIPELAKVDAT
jgi:hypothetical protein